MKLCPMCECPLTFDPARKCASCKCGWSGDFAFGLTEPRLPTPKPLLPYVSIDIETTGLEPETCQMLEIGAVYDDWTLPLAELPRFRRVIRWKTVQGSPFAMSLNANLLKAIATAPTDPPQCTYEAVQTWTERCSPGMDRWCEIENIVRLADRQMAWWEIPNELLPRLCHPVTKSQFLSLAANPPGASCYCQPDELAGLFKAWLVALGVKPRGIQAAGKNFASFDMQFLYRLPKFRDTITFQHRVIDPANLFWLPTDERLPDSKQCYERAGIPSKVAHTALEDALAVVRLVRAGYKRLPKF